MGDRKKFRGLTREELYELVWSVPSTEIAKELGISDVALTKACRHRFIPKPPTGYRAKVRSGSTCPRPPLEPLPSRQVSKMIKRATAPSMRETNPSKPDRRVWLHRVALLFADDVFQQIELERKRLGITRSAMLKMWIGERLYSLVCCGERKDCTVPLDSIPHQELKRLCTKWQIAKLELFGSALREDFSPQSDVDIMVTFDAGKTPDLFKFMDLKEELELIFKRRVDLLTRPAIERSRNRLRKEEILTTAKVLYDKAA